MKCLHKPLWVSVSLKHKSSTIQSAFSNIKAAHEKAPIVLVKQTFLFLIRGGFHLNFRLISMFIHAHVVHLRKLIICIDTWIKRKSACTIIFNWHSNAPLKPCVCAQCTDQYSVYTTKLRIETKQDKKYIEYKSDLYCFIFVFNYLLLWITIFKAGCTLWTWHWFYGYVIISKLISFMEHIRNIVRQTDV